MRNMVVLIDTNVILNYITSRPDPYSASSTEIMGMCSRGECIGYVAFHSISTLWYVLRKMNVEERRQNLRDICEILMVASASQKEILKAIDNDPFHDFEDCLQDKCAKCVNADYIITCNVRDFDKSEVMAITPDDFIRYYKAELDSIK